MVLLLHHDFFARSAEAIEGGFFFLGQSLAAGQPLEPRLLARKPAAIFLDEPDVTANAHVDQGGSEGAVVGAHLVT